MDPMTSIDCRHDFDVATGRCTYCGLDLLDYMSLPPRSPKKKPYVVKGQVNFDIYFDTAKEAEMFVKKIKNSIETIVKNSNGEPKKVEWT
jgi:hypothetical protein